MAAIEAVYPAFRDLEGLRAYAVRGRRDGFQGMLAIHPAQVPSSMRSLRRAPPKLNMRNAWLPHSMQTSAAARLRSMARCWMLPI